MTLQELNNAITNINTSVNKLVSDSLAYISISERATDAHNYCQKYSMPNAWGRNIWHVILDDAIRLREENLKLQEELKNK